MHDYSQTINSVSEKVRGNVPVVSQLMLIAVILLLIFGGAITSLSFMPKGDPDPTTAVTESTDTDTRAPKTTDTEPAFSNVSVTAKAAYVWDIANERSLYEKNADEQLPLASITKLMTALVAHEILREEEEITIGQQAILQDGISTLAPGETFDRQSLSDLTLLSSSNDGAFALGYAAGAVLTQNDPANAFVQAMNIRAEEIGLTDTYFKNPTGLDISLTEGGAYGTAKDMASLMEYIVKNEPSLLEYTKKLEANITDNSGRSHSAENTNYFVHEIPGLIGSKTGFTDLAGGNLIVAFEGGLNRPFVVVVLGSTRQERFSDVITLANEVQKYLVTEQ